MYEQLIQKGETQEVEFKERFPQNASDIAKEIAAVANSNGGMLFIGISDDSRVSGIERSDEIIQRIAGVVRQSCDPPLQPRIEKIHLQGKVVVVVTIFRHTVPVAVNGKFYVRVGTSVMTATSRDLTKLLVRNLLERIDLLDIIASPFEGFSPENLMPVSQENQGERLDEDAEAERIKLYGDYEGVFVVHRWLPSSYPGQKADIMIHIVQHNEGPLTAGQVESVDYYLGPKFPGSPYHKMNAEDNFALQVSAYAPMLCLAKITLKNGKTMMLYRYCDFPIDLNSA